MIIRGMSRPLHLMIAGFFMPYLAIILIAAMISRQPGMHDEKLARLCSCVLPLLLVLLSAVIVGIGNVKKEQLVVRGAPVIRAFIFGFFWTAVGHLFITIYLFMQIVYFYAGVEH